MSELQNEGFSIEQASDDITEAKPTEAIENPVKGPDLATESEVKEEVKAEPTEEEKEAKRQAAFNKQYGEKKQMERERDAAIAEAQRLQQAQQPETPQDVGEFPSEYDYDTDEEYKTAKTDFVNRVQKAEQYKHQQQYQTDYTQQQQARAQQQTQEKFNKDMISYTESARRNNIKPDELQQAADAVNSYGMTHSLGSAILADPDGPLITKYLAANPQEVSNLVNMDPYTAGAHLNNLKAKAAALKPKTSSAPKPTTDISGSGGESERSSPLIKGATFE